MLMACASISKMLLVLCHMGLSIYSPRTFARQWALVFASHPPLEFIPSWPSENINMLCTTIMKVVHFELVQV